MDGELLRKPLAQHLLDHGVSPEAAVVVEYVPAVVPPEARQALPHDEWVAAVAGCDARGCLASGAYDGGVRLWGRGGDCLAGFAAHAGGVTAAAWLPESQGSLLLTAGKDASVRLWEVPTPSSGKGRSGKSSGAAAPADPRLVSVCAGHSDTVAALAVSPSGEVAASGGWDGKLSLWATGRRVVEEADAGDGGDKAAQQQSKKKRRVGKDDVASAGVPSCEHQQEATGQLEGHVHCVSALCWTGGGSGGMLVSGGWDHSVRLWDVGASRAVATYNGSKAVYAVAAAPGSSSGGGGGAGGHVIAFGGAEGALRVWDARAKGEALSVRGYAAGGAWVSGLAWRPDGGGHHVASASHDGSLRLWDLRTPVPLGTLKQHTDKALCVAWWGADTVATGGADCRLQLYELPSTASGADEAA